MRPAARPKPPARKNCPSDRRQRAERHGFPWPTTPPLPVCLLMLQKCAFRYFWPCGEGLGAARPEVGGGVVVSAAGEKVGELVMGGKEALHLPRRLEPLHDPFSSSGRLIGVFGPVIEAVVLPMLDPGHDLPLGCGASRLASMGSASHEISGGKNLVIELAGDRPSPLDQSNDSFGAGRAIPGVTAE